MNSILYLKQNEIITDDLQTTPIGLARYAYEYLDSAILVEERATEKKPGSQISPIPAYFLAFHGIELTLKSFLRSKEVTVNQLRSREFGHDLCTCYRKAKEFGLAEIFKEDTKDVAVLEMLEDLNDKQGLRYIRTGSKNFPLWSIVERFAVRLHQAVALHVGYESFNRSYTDYN
jgi:hypothetical protein